MKTSFFNFLFLTLLFSVFYANVFSQTTTTPATTTPPATVTPPVAAITPPVATPAENIPRPSQPLDVPEIDNYVTASFGLYDQTNQLQTQLNAIEQQVLVGKLSKMDTNNIEVQLKGFNTQLVTLRATGLNLAQASSAMSDNVYKDLKGRPLKIPGAIVRVKNATKAVKVSLKNIHTMMTVTMVNIDHKLNIPVKSDTTANKGTNTTVANTGKTIKTSISITGITFSVFNSFSSELNGITSIKSLSKKFNASGTSVINVVHYGSTDDLLAAILANCKDVVSDKNVSSTEEGKISFAL